MTLTPADRPLDATPLARRARRAHGGRWHRPAVALVLGTLALTQLSGCVALLGLGAVAGGGMVYVDRRTSGTQIEDEAIELKGGRRAGEVMGGRGHLNVTSFNRVVLVTGEVPEEADKEAVGRALAGIDNVSRVQNEIEIGFSASITSRSNDALITSKVKASLIDAKDLQSNVIKVITEHGVVYLMGVVSQREADRAAEVARGVNGVKKVVRVFQVLSDDELAHIQSR